MSIDIRMALAHYPKEQLKFPNTEILTKIIANLNLLLTLSVYI
jgi:hypothetical protein